MKSKRYKISYDGPINNGLYIGKTIFYIGILSLFCVLTFLVVKYIVNIGIDETPIDTSQRI